MNKRILWVLLACVAAVLAMRAYYTLTDDFRLGNVTHPMPYHVEWEIAIGVEQRGLLEEALSQKYSYIGKGAQSYAFVSDDGRYVIKLFKFKHLRPSPLLNTLKYLPFCKEYCERKAQRKQRTLQGVFDGYRLAYEVHRHEAGLHFIQLNTGSNINKIVVLRDKLGLEHSIDLSQVVFILQEKVETSRKVINSLLDQRNVKGAVGKISTLFDLYMTEYAKGIVDHDHGILHNTGFIGDRPVHLDVGKMHAEEAIKDRELSYLDLSEVARRIHVRLREQYPDQAEAVERGMNDYFLREFGKSYEGFSR